MEAGRQVGDWRARQEATTHNVGANKQTDRQDANNNLGRKEMEKKERNKDTGGQLRSSSSRASIKSAKIIPTKKFRPPSFARPTCPGAGPPHVSSFVHPLSLSRPLPATVTVRPPFEDLPGRGRGGKPPTGERRPSSFSFRKIQKKRGKARRLWLTTSEFYLKAFRCINLRDSRPGWFNVKHP